MKKMFLLCTMVCFTLSACIPAIFQQPQATSPAPLVPEVDVQATVAVQVEETIQSLPTPTLAPSNTPVVITATNAPTQTLPQPTSTATLNTTLPPASTSTVGTGTAVMTAGTVGTLPFTATSGSSTNVTPTGTAHYQYYGTMPPDLPFGSVALFNKSKRDAYISLQCTTSGGYVTVIEYPVGGSTVGAKAPAGQYIYVAWIGGKKFTGSFHLSKQQDIKIFMYKDRIEIR